MKRIEKSQRSLLRRGATFAFIGLMGCQGMIDSPPVDPPPPPPEMVVPPSRDPIGPAELPPGRALRRMTAAQFNASLTVATGQTWANFDRYAAALGRADFAQVTEEGLEFNVTFEKLVEDAARETCRAAVRADVAAAEGTEPAILRFVTAESMDEGEYNTNLSYLFMRFLGQPVSAGDPALAPWLGLLTAPPAEETELDAATMQDRWTAVCVGLVTHPDFVAY